VPVGTGDDIERIVQEANPLADVAVVSNPEFLREGAAIRDFQQPDRVVVGIEDERARAVMAELYQPICANHGSLMITERRTAELIKYSANAFLAMKITFINEIADLCEKTGANVEDVSRGIGLDNRIGAKFLLPGPGYGGSCFPKDTLALARIGQDNDSPLRLVETTISINEQRKRAMGRKVIAACGGSVRGKTIGILGLTFKPDTDDMRDAPSIAIIQALRDGGAVVRAFDPEGAAAAKALMPDIDYVQDEYQVADGADCLVLVTEWAQFRTLNLRRIKRAMRVPRFVDLRNVFRRGQLEEQGFSYFSIGRPELLGSGVAEAAE
jgi:UDPglucose 6-dehydrogenase